VRHGKRDIRRNPEIATTRITCTFLDCIAQERTVENLIDEDCFTSSEIYANYGITHFVFVSVAGSVVIRTSKLWDIERRLMIMFH
jgi:hypothetical protein